MFEESVTKQEIAQLMKGAPNTGIVEVRMKDPSVLVQLRLGITITKTKTVQRSTGHL